jgi:hypothetical protein
MAFTGTTGTGPDWVTGWIDGATPNSALDFLEGESKFVELTDIKRDALASTDPNLSDLTYDISASAWVKVPTEAEVDSYGAVLGVDGIEFEGESSWAWNMLFLNGKYMNFRIRGTARDYLGAGSVDMSVVDGYWHHVCGIYDGETVSMYVDGILDNSMPDSGTIPNTDTDNNMSVVIASELSGDGKHPWVGSIDDVRIYSYPLTASQVLDLANTGINLVPFVDCGPNVEHAIQLGDLNLAATVIDNDVPADTLSYTWTMTSGPVAVTFDPCDNPTTDVTFPQVGIYKLQLTVGDSTVDISDEVQVTVWDPTCADVILDGLTLTSDISGPSDGPDCQVDIYDMSQIAEEWIKCNDPADPDCEVPAGLFQ